MSSYVKRRNCCLLKKSKKYFEGIRQNTNQMLDVINEFTIKGEFCEFKDGDMERLFGMRCAIGEVIEGWAEHTYKKLNGEVGVKSYGIATSITGTYTIGEMYTGTDNNGKTIETKYIGQDDDGNHIMCSKEEAESGDYANYGSGSSIDIFNYDPDIDGTKYSINFGVNLYMVGSKLQAEAVYMFELADVIKAPFVDGTFDEFKEEYDSNPDILIEDISEFLQAIDKLENLMKQLSIDNQQRDPDTEFCCVGNPPPGGKLSC